MTGMSARANVAPIGIGLLGLGVVGSAVAKAVLSWDKSQDRNIPLALVGAVIRDPNKKRSIDIDQSILSDDPQAVIGNTNIAIVVELMGGENPAFDYISTSLKAGKHVVTANKEVMCKRGDELLGIAADNNVELKYEASVGGGIPIIGPLTNDLAANKIQSIRAIINGTTNFILTKMAHEGADFDDVLTEAQSLGYAEADPTADVDGFDPMYKLSVLARLAYHTEMPIEVIHREGIRDIHAKDFRYAAELGYTIKLLAAAQARDGSELLARVHPALIPLEVPMASVNGVLNAVEVEGDLVGPLWFQGPGAGAEPTASAVVGDILKITESSGINSYRSAAFASFNIGSMSDHVCQYYMRLTASDQPGVLANVARVLGNASISISAVLQKDTDLENAQADLVIMTHPAREANMQTAVSLIRKLETVIQLDNLIRVENYAGRL
ncbi:MAG: homoserine dehydrogenase [Chloroflexota bacterium]|nr:homoserine dehydrogenase [Chloroflexota bacterium]